MLPLNFPGGTLLAKDVAIQRTGGKVVVAGIKGDNAAVARFNVDGSLDTSFGQGGVWEWPQDQITSANAVTIQGDGGILVTGHSDATGRMFATARLLSTGQPDSSFSGTGIVRTDVGDNETGADIAVQADGKVVVLGTALTGTIDRNDDFVFLRYNPNGSLDGSFGDGGVKLAGFDGSDAAAALAIDYNGNPATNQWWGTIVAAGMKADGNRWSFAVARLTPNGEFDNSFDGNGRLITDFPGVIRSRGTGVAIQPGGKIVAAGWVEGTVTLTDFGLVRYLPNGAIDNSFGPNGNGRVVTDLGGNELGGGNDLAMGLATGFLGGLLVGGVKITYNPTLDPQLATVAYTRDGMLDTRFSGDGIALADFDGEIPWAGGIATTGNSITPIRRVVVAGGAGVARYVDVGSVVSIGSFDPNAAEAGPDPATFIVGRTERLATPERVYLDVFGTAHPPARPPSSQLDYTGTNITFVDPTAGASYVDIPANETFTVATITPIDDARVEGDESAFFGIASDPRYDIGTPPNTTLAIRDNDTTGGPTVAMAQFAYQTAPQRVSFRFSQNVEGSISASDFQLTGPAGMPAHTFAYDNITNTATLTFQGILPDADYSARAIAAGITNAQGQPMPSDYLLNFFFLQGDANHDRQVSLADFNILAANFGQSNRNFTHGDFNYDGQVNLQDFNILAGRFGVNVSPTVGDAARGGGRDDEGELPDELSELLA
jgi:uncharacterized delta-60 repeat protein